MQLRREIREDEGIVESVAEWTSEQMDALMKTLGKMSPEERQTEGPRLQGMRARVEGLHERLSDQHTAPLK